MAADFRARELLEGADEQKRHELMQARGPVGPPRKRWLPFLWISLPFDFKDSLFCILLSLLVGVAVIYRHIFFENPEKKDQKHIIIPMSHRNTDIFGRHGFVGTHFPAPSLAIALALRTGRRRAFVCWSP